ncbi:MAG: ribosome biogenesis GTPase Der, partial [Candidatus Riflebacteria bacterium]|nr:ribosome biogenesis GTPase Der [Candidatus Riflebacteria bacterium]
MDSLPVIAIVGRPNVGKSSLMNRLVGYRHAIVDPTPGVTRDRNYAEATWNRRKFNVVDTGGLEPDNTKSLMTSIKSQVNFALQEANAIIFVCDGQAGLVPDDKQIYNFLRKRWSGRPLFVCVNKLDNTQESEDIQLSEFFEFGAENLYPISAIHGHGVADMLDDLVEILPVNADPKNQAKEEDDDDKALERIAIVGKPNVGKSALFNALIGQDRSIVDNVEGTTRDTILYHLDREGKRYSFIDTAGLRRPDATKDDVETYSAYRTLGTIKRTDLAILVLDASREGITHQDKRIAGKIIESGAGCIIVWNKWDIANPDEHRWDELKKQTREEFPLLEFAPMIAISAKTGLRLNKLFDTIDHVQEVGRRRIPDEILKSILYDAVTIQPPPAYKGKELKIKSIE